MNILKYRQLIDTECSNQQNTQLSVKAVKLDGQNSLKMAIGCGDLKSCDYMRYKKDKILLIEISDLKMQIADLIQKTSCISQECKDSLGKTIQKRIEPTAIINHEMKDKCIQTNLILYKLSENIQISLDKIKILIVAICSDSLDDIIAFNFIKINLKQTLKSLVGDVKIVLAKDLEKVIYFK